MALTDIEYQVLEDIVGPDNITRDPAILDTYNQVWGNKMVFDQKWSTRPAAVLLPANTAEIQAIVKACNRYHIAFKPFSSGFEIVSLALESQRGILLDLKRMDRILEIDVKNMLAVVEPYVSIYAFQRELAKYGFTIGPVGCGPNANVVAASCCHFGAGASMISTGGLGRSVLSTEWVLPTGEILKMGSLDTVGQWFSGDGPGPSLRGVLRGRSGANGGHGVITKCSVKIYPWYGETDWDFVEAYGNTINGKRLSKVPDKYRGIIVKFADKNTMFEALLRIGRAEIAHSLMAALLFPYGAGNDEQFEAFKQDAVKGIDYTELATTSVALVMGSETSRGMAYRQNVLQKICDDLNGFMLPMEPRDEAGLFAALMHHFGFLAGGLRRTGDFFVSPTADVTLDVHKNLRDVAVEIVKPYMEKGLVQQQGEPELYLSVSEHNSVGTHSENVIFYDPWEENSLNAAREIAHQTEDVNGVFRHYGIPHLGGGLQIESVSHVHQNWGPTYDNYEKWMQKVKKLLDPNTIGDWSAYIPPIFP